MSNLSQKITEKKREDQYSMLIADIVTNIKNTDNLRRIYKYAEALLSEEERNLALTVKLPQEFSGILES